MEQQISAHMENLTIVRAVQIVGFVSPIEGGWILAQIRPSGCCPPPTHTGGVCLQ
jgi:hypothetical protein